MMRIFRRDVRKSFLNAYRLTGTLYHRHRLSLASIYEKILEKYYPDGLKVYDADEIKKFRELVASEYGDIELPIVISITQGFTSILKAKS